MTNSLSFLLTDSKSLQPVLQRLPDIVSLLLIIACAYTLANMTWMLLPQNDITTSNPDQSNDTHKKNQPNSKRLFRELSNAHLFGVAQKKATAVSTKAPETKLKMILKGVLAATPMNMAIAIISPNKKGKDVMYGIGDKLPGNVTLKEIHPDHVILSRSGRLETLRLPKDSDSSKVSSGFAPTANTISPQNQSLNDIRNDILKNPTAFGDYALPVVVKQNGKQIGYRLQFQKKGDVLKQAGLLSTDIVTSINGIKLNNPKEAMRALQKLSKTKQLDMIVQRNGANVPINLQLQ